MRFLEELNPSQYEAATHIDGSLLILAGAGSGKTKTLTSRLAYLLSLGIDPQSTLTLTFTNKAANEMKQRALNLIEDKVTSPPLLTTFHKFGLIFLKRNIHLLNRDSNFVIIDTDDKRRIIKGFSKDLNVNSVAMAISRYKNSFLTPNQLFHLAENREERENSFIYQQYIDYLNRNNLVDFDDLLLLTFTILDKFDDIAIEYSQRYQYIMVDEYQDTNEIQFKILRKLTTTHNNICVVGDDDQSIYGFRGADIRNILEFHKLFDAKIIRLEENYRSTPQILEVANKLISFNKQRHQKVLKPMLKGNKEVEVIGAYNERSESDIVAERISKLIKSGVSPNSIAVLYRINSLSRAIEDGLRYRGINYRLIGGIKFYEREEIKDIISYLRLILNPNDDHSFKRVVNKPRRGVGKVTLEKLEEMKGELSFMQLLDRELSFLGSKKAIKALKEFREIIFYFSTLPVKELVGELDRLMLKQFYKDSEKVQNLEEFISLLEEFADKGYKLEEILNELSLENEKQNVKVDEAVSLMSVHASKGLEFDYLFVIGMVEGLFPLRDADIEEERRLAYVAVTRAKRELVLSYIKTRFNRDSEPLQVSRFLTEMGLIKNRGGFVKIEGDKRTQKNRLVKHPVFGIGKVIGSCKVRNGLKLKIDFGGDVREILDSYVKDI